jgi:hypothetical protein
MLIFWFKNPDGSGVSRTIVTKSSIKAVASSTSATAGRIELLLMFYYSQLKYYGPSLLKVLEGNVTKNSIKGNLTKKLSQSQPII